MLKVYADFNRLDSKGRVFLTFWELLKKERAQLQIGLRVLVWDGELEVEGNLEFEDDRWRARIDWKTLKDRATGEHIDFSPDSH
jgi:hypothetical protein